MASVTALGDHRRRDIRDAGQKRHLIREKAAKLMKELGEAIQREVGGQLGALAGKALRIYGRALIVADA